jgi:hypothetical protein
MLLGACANVSLQGRQTQPQVHTESECLVAADSSKCRLENALAGGPPISLAQD